MTALTIITVIAVLLFILLSSSVTAELEYDRVFKFKIKYLFFTLAKDPLSPKEQKKKKRREEKKAKKEEKAKEKEKKTVKKNPSVTAKKTLPPPPKKTEKPPETKTTNVPPQNEGKSTEQKKSEEKKQSSKGKITPELVFGIWGKAKPHVKRIFKKIRITDVYADIIVGGEDAAKTAVSYGAHCAAVNGLAAFLENTVTFKAEKINIRADFDLEKSVYYAKATVKLRLSTLLHSGLWGAAAIFGELKSLTADSEALNNAPKKAA